MVGIKHLALLAGAVLPALGRPSFKREAPQAIPGKFIVTLKSDAAVSNHLNWVKNVQSQSMSTSANSGVEKVFNIENFQAYSGTFDEETIAQIAQSPQVASVEPDMIWSLYDVTTQPNAPWGLGSISHRAKGSTDYIYESTATGEDTYAYIVDTGVNAAHVELEGRAVNGYNAYPGAPAGDRHGHGTHCAGTVASRAYGVAKKANVVAIKVFDTGSSTTAIVMDGFQWAVNNITAEGRQGKSVISMSLGGPYSQAFNDAIAAAYNAGILSVVAAGNSAWDASNYSPASEPTAITVGAADVNNEVAYFSNYGSVVDIFAPGVDVLSCYIGASNKETRRMDGTSMATPHVAGLTLYLKSLYDDLDSPAATTAKLLELGTKDVLTSLADDTVNLIAYNGNGA